MNLGPRCDYLLENQTQCPNTVVDGSEYCALHIALMGARTTPPTNTDKHIDENERAES